MPVMLAMRAMYVKTSSLVSFCGGMVVVCVVLMWSCMTMVAGVIN